jgi:hypothetical protein
MKNLARIFTILSIAAFATAEVTAQCTPDTVNCIDIDDPGQICPSSLPDLIVNVPYDTAITIIPPDTFMLDELPIVIAYVIVDTVLNLPPGIQYEANADIFYPDTAYCVRIFGTPTEAGEYPLGIHVTPYVYIGLPDPIASDPIIDSTSVIVTVQGTSGFNPFEVQEFRVLPNVPNPFTEITRLGYYTPINDRVELKVYNILGKLMHEEKQGASPGEHFFQFDGSQLIPGTYFYQVTNSSAFYTGKFIKSK